MFADVPFKLTVDTTYLNFYSSYVYFSSQGPRLRSITIDAKYALNYDLNHWWPPLWHHIKSHGRNKWTTNGCYGRYNNTSLENWPFTHWTVLILFWYCLVFELFKVPSVVIRYLKNRPVSEMRAPLGGLSRTSGELWQDFLSCCMFLNIKRNIF